MLLGFSLKQFGMEAGEIFLSKLREDFLYDLSFLSLSEQVFLDCRCRLKEGPVTWGSGEGISFLLAFTFVWCMCIYMRAYVCACAGTCTCV